MAEPRRVPFVSLLPMKPRESAGTLIEQQQQQRNSSLISATQRSQSMRPPLAGTQQQSRPPQQTPTQRPQREVAASSSIVGEAGSCHPITSAEENNPNADGTVRLELALSDPTDERCPEFSYREMLKNEQRRVGDGNPGQISVLWFSYMLRSIL
ncbi:PREDICTED: ubinuclein-2-like [Nanorana parkeri]|uniref:ubinuclein-2-like n=1 Tax=Nanorana parkeri TaxID=125878 RepID=UPI0008542A94|nr:PREDICTED: ubinuclein-2-like [Nanorana parkeri]